MSRYSSVLLLLCTAACAASAQRAPGPRGPAADEVQVPRTVVTPTGASSIPELLRDAAALGAQGKWGEAAAAYDRAYRLEPDGSYGDDAVWGAADAYDRANDVEKALTRFELFVQRQPASLRGEAAMLRATRLLVFMGRFEAAGVYADRLLGKLDTLNELGKVAVLSAKALALLEREQDDQASYHIEKGRSIIEANRLDEAVPLPRDLAQLYYALGELRRLRAERIVFDPMPENFGGVLEARCQLLLDAQSAYSDTMRANDAHWTAMAGYRVTELYQRLHSDLMVVRPPPSADTERKRQLFEGAVRTRYAILLSKAKGMAEHTLAMAARTGEHSPWVDRTKDALKTIDQGIKDEEAALAKLPYTKQDFDAYFAEAEAAAQAAAKKAAPSPAPTKRPR